MIQPTNLVFFCHGAPGSPRDAELLLPFGLDTVLIAHDIFNAPPDGIITQTLAAFDQAAEPYDRDEITVVGFSIGAMVALKLASARADKIGNLALISPAAPLTLGNFLPQMAGKPVFDLTKNSPGLLRFLTKLQCLLTSFAPKLLVNQLFHRSGSTDRALLKDAQFHTILKAGFKNSFCRHPKAYTTLLQDYIADWAPEIGAVSCPVTLWHGDQDAWAPIAMSHALQGAFSNATLNTVAGAGHYATLAHAKPIVSTSARSDLGLT